MPVDLDGDLGVDVLIVGAGIQGLYLAQSLHPTYTVCVVDDPAVGSETLNSSGYISAGYDGNDANRIQPARRAAGFWRLWAESHGLSNRTDTSCFLDTSDEGRVRPSLWDEAMLPYHEADAIPEIFGSGDLVDATAYILDDDVVVDPAALLTALRAGLESNVIEGEVLRFGLVADRFIDHVQVQTGEVTLPIVPRFVVLAAGIGNAGLLGLLAKRFTDQTRRKEAADVVRSSQAVLRATTVCLRGPELPMVSGSFGGMRVVAHRLTDSADVVWVLQPPPDGRYTTLGAQDLRFDPPTDDPLVAETVERLFAVAPAIEKLAGSLRWSCYTSRRAQHPMLAVEDSTSVAQPVPAKLEAFGLEAFLALWPSHLGYAMVLGDVVSERIAAELGDRGDFVDGTQPADVAGAPRPLRARWDCDDLVWSDWETFAEGHDLETG